MIVRHTNAPNLLFERFKCTIWDFERSIREFVIRLMCWRFVIDGTSPLLPIPVVFTVGCDGTGFKVANRKTLAVGTAILLSLISSNVVTTFLMVSGWMTILLYHAAFGFSGGVLLSSSSFHFSSGSSDLTYSLAALLLWSSLLECVRLRSLFSSFLIKETKSGRDQRLEKT
jgi:hypothetical protein